MTKPTTNKRPRRMAREPQQHLDGTQKDTGTEAAPPGQADVPASPKAPSKTEQVLTLLKREGGVTLDELVAATGWLPHTTRAALTGLKKKGHQIHRTKVDGISRYTAVDAAAQ